MGFKSLQIGKCSLFETFRLHLRQTIVVEYLRSSTSSQTLLQAIIAMYKGNHTLEHMEILSSQRLTEVSWATHVSMRSGLPTLFKAPQTWLRRHGRWICTIEQDVDGHPGRHHPSILFASHIYVHAFLLLDVYAAHDLRGLAGLAHSLLMRQQKPFLFKFSRYGTLYRCFVVGAECDTCMSSSCQVAVPLVRCLAPLNFWNPPFFAKACTVPC